MSEENKYFEKIEAEKRARLARELKAQREAEARAQRKATHWLKCGKCGADMDTRVFRGVEIEVCPDCGAVLLDQGELETLAGADKSGVFAHLRELFKGG